MCSNGTTLAFFVFFAPVISRLFFPSEQKLASLIGTFGVNATGFLMRPLGGLLFGHIGDRLGRKRALELSVLLMAVPTTLLGLLPTYAQIGLWASLLLTLFRLMQGLSVGGEYIGSMSFLSEHAPPHRCAFLGSFSSFERGHGVVARLGRGGRDDRVLESVAVLCMGMARAVRGRRPDRSRGSVASPRSR